MGVLLFYRDKQEFARVSDPYAGVRNPEREGEI